MAYMGFNALKSKLAGRPGVTNPGALAATIGRAKYGTQQFNSAAAKGKSLKGAHAQHGQKVAHELARRHKAKRRRAHKPPAELARERAGTPKPPWEMALEKAQHRNE